MDLPPSTVGVENLSRAKEAGTKRDTRFVGLATGEEVALRHDDVFIEIDQAYCSLRMRVTIVFVVVAAKHAKCKLFQALQACFLISEGYVRVSVPAMDLEAKLGSLEDASRIAGIGRLPHHSSRLPSGVRKPKMVRSDEIPSRFSLAKGDVPVFQLGNRPLLLPPSESGSPASNKTPRPSRLITRPPGTPRRGSNWQKSLRHTQVLPFLGGGPGDIELCLLHAGEAFGLAALYDQGGECTYLSSCEVQVQSSEAKILVLTQASLLYLNETLARRLVDKAKSQEDPVAPSFQNIKRERQNRSHWAVRKQQVLHQVLVQED